MDDTLKNLSLGIFLFLIVNGSLQQRAKRAAEQQMRDSFQNSGQVWARVEPRGPFGIYASDFWAVDIYGKGITTERLPFYVYPRGGWKGSIRHLRLHFTDFTLKGTLVDRFEADIPFANFDLGHATWKNRLHLRSAGVGQGEVRVGAGGLRAFILRKYSKILSDVEVSFPNKKITISGKATLLATPAPFTATGQLLSRNGRYIDLIDPEIRLNGLLLNPLSATLVLRQLNPVLDVETDLGLGGFFTITDVEIGEGFLSVRGRVTLPPEPKSEKR